MRNETLPTGNGSWRLLAPETDQDGWHEFYATYSTSTWKCGDITVSSMGAPILISHVELTTFDRQQKR
jgi:hypothetical protein